MDLTTLGLVLAVIAAGAALRYRQLALPVLLGLGIAIVAGYSLSFADFLRDGRIETVELIRFALAVSVIGLAAARLGRIGLVLSVLAGVGVLVLHGRVFQNYLADDAFISFRYAQNLAEGHGVVWNTGEPVEGYTNFLWVLMLAPFEKLGWDTPGASQALGFAAAVAVWIIGFAFLREWRADRPDDGGTTWAMAAYALILPSCGAFTMWAFSGMETALFAALVLASTYLVVREDSWDNRGPPWSAILLLLVALARFDGLVLFPVAAALKAWPVVRKRDRESLTRFCLWLAAFAIPYAAYYGWRSSYYGYPLPNTFYAKVDPDLSPVEQFERGIRYLHQFVRDYAGVIVLPAAISLAVRRPLRHGVYVAAVIVVWTGYVVYVGGDFMVQSRFFVPIVPLLYVLAAEGAVSAVLSLRERVEARALAVAASATLLAAVTMNLGVSQFYIAEMRELNRIDRDRVVVGRWLRDNVPDDYVVLVDAAGAVPYYSRLGAIDNLGINDETIAHTDIPLGGGTPGHEKSNAAYVLSRRPDIFFDWNPLAGEPWTKEFWMNNIVGTKAGGEFMSLPETFNLYEARSAQLEDGRWFNYLELREEERLRE